MLNRVLMEGFLLRKPELRKSKTGHNYASFLLGLKQKLYVDNDGIVPVLPTIAVPCVFFGGYCEDFVKQRQAGDIIQVEGKISGVRSGKFVITIEKIHVSKTMYTRKQQFLKEFKSMGYRVKEQIELIERAKKEMNDMDQVDMEEICKYL